MSTLATQNTLNRLAPGAFACAIAGAGVVGLAVGPLAGALCQAIVLLALLDAYVLMPDDVVSMLQNFIDLLQDYGK